MEHLMVVTLPGDANKHPKAEGLIEKFHELAREIESLLGLDKHTIQSEAKTASSGSISIKLPKNVPTHPDFLQAWKRLGTFAKEIESELSIKLTGPVIDFVSAKETA